MPITVSRHHDFSYGHRVVGHEHKCRYLHGHNARVVFTCSGNGLDTVGRVIDFSQIKRLLCGWVEEHWDHRFLMWSRDPIHTNLLTVQMYDKDQIGDSIVTVPFNPTAENMAGYLLHEVGPKALESTGITLVEVTLHETRKCWATVRR